MHTLDKQLVNEEMAMVIDYLADTFTVNVLNHDGRPTGESITINHRDGQLLWTDGDTIVWDGAPFHWRNGTLIDRLDEPSANALIVFERDDKGRVMAWTYETEYHECVKYASFVQFRIVNDQNTLLWAGLYSEKHDELITHDGQRPRQLEEEMIVEIGDNPHGDNPYGSDICWAPAHDQERFWSSLVKASKR